MGELHGSVFLGAIPFDEYIPKAVRLATLPSDPSLAQPCLAAWFIGGRRDFDYIGFATIFEEQG